MPPSRREIKNAHRGIDTAKKKYSEKKQVDKKRNSQGARESVGLTPEMPVEPKPSGVPLCRISWGPGRVLLLIE